MTEMILKNSGINWTWYCHVIIEDGFARVTKEYRLHDFDPSQGSTSHPEKTDGYYRIREKDFPREIGKPFPPRIAIGIEINDSFYPFKREFSRFSLGK